MRFTLIKSEGRRPLVRSRESLDYNIKMDLKEICCGLDSPGSQYVPVASTCEHGNEPPGSI